MAGFVPSTFTQKYSSAFNWGLSGHRHAGSPFTNKNKQKKFGFSPSSVLLPYISALFMILSGSTQNGRTRGCIFMPALLTTVSTDTDSWTQSGCTHGCVFMTSLFMTLSTDTDSLTQNGHAHGCVFMPALLMTLSTDADGWTQNGHSHGCVFTTFKH